MSGFGWTKVQKNILVRVLGEKYILRGFICTLLPT
jgi:hypothetical protein